MTITQGTFLSFLTFLTDNQECPPPSRNRFAISKRAYKIVEGHTARGSSRTKPRSLRERHVSPASLPYHTLEPNGWTSIPHIPRTPSPPNTTTWSFREGHAPSTSLVAHPMDMYQKQVIFSSKCACISSSNLTFLPNNPVCFYTKNSQKVKFFLKWCL